MSKIYVEPHKLERIMQYVNENGESEACKEFGINIETLHRYQRLSRFNNTKQPKFLLLDIETSPLSVYTWDIKKPQYIPHTSIIENSFLIGWSAKWLFGAEILSDILTPAEALEKNDNRIVNSAWKLMESADIICGHNCVEINTLILKQDLTWVKAGNLKVGDKIVGFEEKTPPDIPQRRGGKWVGINGKERKVLPTEVESFSIEKKHCYKVIFDNGDYIICTDNHYWLGMAEKDRNQSWYRTDKLRIGQRVNKYLNTWNQDTSYEAGWLSGFISAEGILKRSKKRYGGLTSIDFCQRPGETLDQAIDFCNKLNIPISPTHGKKGGLGSGDTLYVYTLGGKWKTIETIGRLNIKRFINKIDWTRFGGLNGIGSENGPRRTSVIVDIIDVGEHDVAVFSTSEKTFIANGYPMHNCKKFDLPYLNYRFVMNGLKPPSPFQTIDTLEKYKKHFKFATNRLDYLGVLIRQKGKIKTDMDLWIGCLNGDQQSLLNMQTYNKEDVVLLEDAYLFIRPFIHSHPNLAIYQEATELSCPTCGSVDITECGHYTTMVNQYLAFRCNSCGAICRSRVSDLPLKVKPNILRSTAR